MGLKKGTRYIVDERGNKVGVLLNFKTYTELVTKIKKIEELEEQLLGKIAKERYRTLKRKKLLAQAEMEKRVL